MRVGDEVAKLLKDHAVILSGSDIETYLWYCNACGFLDKETDNHPSMIVEDYIRNLLIDAWDKGYVKGRIDTSETLNLLAFGGLYGKLENKTSENPYYRGELNG